MITKSILQTLLVCLLFTVVTGCNSHQKFDRQKWAFGDGLDFPSRDNIIDDLVKNHQLKGLTYHQVIDSLGSAQRRDTLQLSYQIIDNRYEHGRKRPAHIKNLILYFNKDSVVTRVEVYDHTDKK